MLVRARNLSPSKLNPIFVQSFLTRITQPHVQSNPPNSGTQFSPSTTTTTAFSFFFFSSQSTNRVAVKEHISYSSCVALSRDGNYDEATPKNAVCPGCGVHMQDKNPKQPGYFIKPVENLGKVKKSHLVPVATEPEVSNSLKRGGLVVFEAENESPVVNKPEKPVVCARCHALRHYGKVKDATVENLLPDFDFDHTIGRKLMSASGTRSVVLMVIDAADFDGSFPRKVAKLVSDTVEENARAWKEGKSGNIPRVLLVVTKIDLLPSSLSPTRFEHWVRQRAREGGISKITKLHFVSAVKNWGLKSLIEDVVDLAGKRGNVWTIGAQNAGKSTLLNAIANCVSTGREGKTEGERYGEVKDVFSHLTEAPVPGTTLGIVRVEGVLPAQAKLFDTPGLLNPHQITTRLTRDEQKLVNITKELKPRTYRIKAGHSVHIAGLMRLDVEELSVESIYITVWASLYLPLHMGKTENVRMMVEEHFGRQLQPPIGEKRVKELGKWSRKEFHVSGSGWDSSSVDIAAAGLGWFAVGLKGDAVLGVWTYEGVDVFLRNALLPHKCQMFEVAGFTVSKIVSKADQALNKSKRQHGNKRKQSEPEGTIPAESSLSTVGSVSS